MGTDEDQVYYLKKARQAHERYKVLLGNPKFQEDVLRFRVKWSMSENGIKTDEEAEKWHARHKKQQNEYRTDIRTMMRKHKIAPRQELTIYRYCLYNDSHTPLSMLGTVPIQTADKEGENYTLKLVISPDTTLEDVKQVWSFVKEEQKKLLTWKREKAQPWKNFERDKRAFELQRDNKTLRQIAKIINQEYDTDFGYSDISSIIQRYKKRVYTN